VTQDVEDFLHNDYGKAIVSNASIQFLMKQSTASVPVLAETFYLSQGERQLLVTADVGEGIFFAGQNHVALRVVASDEEHSIITTNPEEIVAKREQDAAARQQQVVEAAQLASESAEHSTAPPTLADTPLPTDTPEDVEPVVPTPLVAQPPDPTELVKARSRLPAPPADSPFASGTPSQSTTAENSDVGVTSNADPAEQSPTALPKPTPPQPPAFVGGHSINDYKPE
jgi:hypothetical protein